MSKRNAGDLDDDTIGKTATSTPKRLEPAISPHANTEIPEPKRPVKSFRLREDLTHQIAILAAQERRKLYELVEEALEEYLERRRQT